MVPDRPILVRRSAALLPDRSVSGTISLDVLSGQHLRSAESTQHLLQSITFNYLHFVIIQPFTLLYLLIPLQKGDLHLQSG